MSDEAIILLVIFALQIKHFLADFVLQNHYMLAHRKVYGHPGGLYHTAIHGAGTALILVVLGVPVFWVAVLVGAEMVIHYHIDWIKDNLTDRWALKPTDRNFWIFLGLDQLMHQATYMALVAVLIALPPLA